MGDEILTKTRVIEERLLKEVEEAGQGLSRNGTDISALSKSPTTTLRDHGSDQADHDTIQERYRFHPKWPNSCQFFDPYTMDARHIRSLLRSDTKHMEQNSSGLGVASALFFADGVVDVHGIERSEPISKFLRSERVQSPQLTAVFIPQKRKYFREGSISQIWISDQSWWNILSEMEILPSFLEVMHTNNSACSRHISYIKDGSIDALHISLKIGPWWRNEAVSTNPLLHLPPSNDGALNALRGPCLR